MRLIVETPGKSVNIEATEILYNDETKLFIIKNNSKIVGAFDVASVIVMYLSGGNK